MSVELATAYVSLTTSARGIKASIENELRPLEQAAAQSGEKAGSSWSRAFGDKSGKDVAAFGLKLAAGAAIAGAGLYGLASAAGNLDAAISANEQVLGQASTAVQEWAEDSVEAVGLSERAAIAAATSFGGLAKVAGLTGGGIKNFSVDMVQLAADLAAFKDVPVDQALTDLQAGFAGSTEVLRKYNVFLDEGSLKSAYFRETGEQVTGTLSAQQRVIATHSEIMRQSVDMQGQAAREADGLARAQDNLKAELENTAAVMGERLLPIAATLVGGLADLAGGVGSLDEATGGMVTTFGVGVTAATGLAGAALFTIGKINQLKTSFSALSSAAKVGVGALAAVPLALAAGAAVYAAYSSSKREAEQRTKDFAAALQAEAEGQRGATAELVTSKLVASGVLGTARELGVSAGDLARAIMGEQIPALERLNEKFNATGVVMASNNAEGEAWRKQTGVSAEETHVLFQRLEELGTGYASGKEALAEYEATQAEVVASTEELGTAADGATEPLEGLANVAASSIDVMSDMERAFAAANDEANGFKDALDRLIGSQIGLDAAGDDLRNGAQALAEAFTANGVTLDANTEKGRANRDAIREQAQAILDYGTSSLEAGTSVEGAADQVNFLTAGLRQQLLDAGLTEAAVDSYIATLGLTPENVTTSLELANQQTARDDIEDHLSRLGEIPESEATEIQALIDEGAWGEVQRRIRELEARKIQLQAQIDLRGTGFTGVGATLVRSAMGNYFDRPSFTSIAEDFDPEAVLTLGKPANLRHQLSDPRIGGPILDALAISGPAPAGARGDFTLINNSRPLSPADIAYAMRMAELMTPGSTVTT